MMQMKHQAFFSCTKLCILLSSLNMCVTQSPGRKSIRSDGPNGEPLSEGRLAETWTSLRAPAEDAEAPRSCPEQGALTTLRAKRAREENGGIGVQRGCRRGGAAQREL